MSRGFTSGAPVSEDGAIRPVRDVVDDYVRETLAANSGRLPQYAIAMHLGISPITLIRMKKRWASEESLLGDRR